MEINKNTSEEMNTLVSNEENLNKSIDKDKRALYIKAQNVIKNAKIEKYMNDREIIAKEGLTFWGAITGKNTLQLQRIENIKLRIELIQTQKIKEKVQYDATDILADLYSCAISELNGKFTDEMKKTYDEIKDKYAEECMADEEIFRLVCEKVDENQSYLPTIHNEKSKGIFGDIKVQINFWKLENKKLQNEIVIERGRSQFETFKKNMVTLKKASTN